MERRAFLRGSATIGAAGLMGPLHALGVRTAGGAPRELTAGYGDLVDKGDLMLPPDFNYVVISRQGDIMSDGNPTPGIFDGMGAFPGSGCTVLIRNHENRRRANEIPVVVPGGLRYDDDPSYVAGNTKLRIKDNPRRGEYTVLESFAILGGTDTNCAGGTTPWLTWITCEEVVNRGRTGKKHGYAYEIDSRATGPHAAIPILGAGRFAHEATAWHGNILYETEDRGNASFYRYLPGQAVKRYGVLADTHGVLQALTVVGEPRANMDVGRIAGEPIPVEWVTVDEPDHDDDTDSRTDRRPGFTPVRIQAQDRGAAIFNRPEGMWVGRGKIYFDCTSGGAARAGQVWEYDPRLSTLTLLFESPDRAVLEAPDNLVVVPKTGDILLQEDGDGDQFLRGVTLDGRIYDFAKNVTNDTEFCGGCFDPDGETLYVSQQGDRPSPPAVTYAIFGPFARRRG
jgi:secreted PhoX family phosphatase